jgi:hypothetical protein
MKKILAIHQSILYGQERMKMSAMPQRVHRATWNSPTTMKRIGGSFVSLIPIEIHSARRPRSVWTTHTPFHERPTLFDA